MRILTPLTRLLHYLSPAHVPGRVAHRSLALVPREILLQFLLNLLLVIALAGLPAVLLLSGNAPWAAPLIAYYAAIFLLAALALARHMNYHLRAGVITALFYLAGLALLVRGGLSGVGVPVLLFAVALSSFLFELTTGLILFAVAGLAFALIGRSMLRGEIPLPGFSEILSSSAPTAWYGTGAIFIAAGLVIVLAAWVNRRGAVRSLEAQRRLTRQVEEELANMESRLSRNAEEARRRLSQFEVASQIARDISAETNLEPLLQNTVNLICERFGFYHAGIFLNDEANEYAVLRAATGEAGRQLLERKHRLKIGETGFIGYVTAKGEARISADVGADSIHYKNPLLPQTRSEMALPLILAGRTIGALDVQSVQENAFTQEDVRILQTVADQLAVAVANARLVEQMKKNVEELETSQQQAVRQVWQTHLRNARRKFAYRYRHAHLDIGASETPQAAEAMSSGQPVMRLVEGSGAGQEKPHTTLAVPIKIRNQVLGVVDVEFESATVSPDLIELIENTVNRLAISLENARLLEEIRYRAERERLVSEITSKVRASAEVDNILKITAQELGRSLGVAEVMVQLRPSDT